MRSIMGFSPGVVLATLIGLLALFACRSSPEGVQQMAQSMEPLAIDAAKERAQTDLNCSALKTTVLSRQTGDISSEYDLHRVIPGRGIVAAACTVYSGLAYRRACAARSRERDCRAHAIVRSCH
jgi:hypothetical protein